MSNLLLAATETIDEILAKAGQMYGEAEYLGALAAFDRVIALDSNHPGAWWNKTCCLQMLGRYDEALVAAERAIELNPNAPICWGNRGVILGYLNRTDDALKAHERALSMDPHYTSAWNLRIDLLKHVGRHAEAEAVERERDAANVTQN